MAKSPKTKYRSARLQVLHKTAAGLAKFGALDKTTMREFDAFCLTKVVPMSADEIQALRQREGVSQAVMAHHLNDVFPIAPLPDATLAARLSHRIEPLGLGNSSRELDLDRASAGREIRVAVRQRPNGVDVIRQYHHRVDLEGTVAPRVAHGGAELIDVLDQQAAVAVKQIDREEVATAWDKGAAIIRRTLQ
jgi:hypothetical protein